MTALPKSLMIMYLGQLIDAKNEYDQKVNKILNELELRARLYERSLKQRQEKSEL